MNTKVFNKNFTLLFSSNLISLMGDVIYLFIISWYILDVTGSTMAMSIFSMIEVVPAIFLMPCGGVLADKRNKKKILVLNNLIRGIVLLGISHGFNEQRLILIYVGALVLGICNALSAPSCTAILPECVEKEGLLKANSLLVMLNGFTNIIGVLCASWIYNTYGIGTNIMINGYSFLISGFLIMFIECKYNAEKEDLDKISLMQEVKEGYLYLRQKKQICRILVSFIVVNLLTAPLSNIYLPYIFNKILNVNTICLSYVQMSYAIGYIVLAIVSSIIIKCNQEEKYIANSLLIEGGCVFLIGIPIIPAIMNYLSINQVVAYFIIIALVLGMGVALINISIQSLCQTKVERAYLGRVSSILNVAIKISLPIGYLVGGFLGDVMPIYAIMIITGILLICSRKLTLGSTLSIEHEKVRDVIG